MGKNGNIYNGCVGKDIVAYIKASQSDIRKPIADNIYLVRILNKPARYIGMQFVYPDGPSLYELIEEYNKSPEIQKNIRQLIFHLNMIGSMTPFAAINYIIHGVGYEYYIKDYAGMDNRKLIELTGQMNDIKQNSLRFQDIKKWLDNIDTSNRMNVFGDGKKEINVTTMHGAKGLEYFAVFIPDVNNGVIPDLKAVRQNTIEEERRLFYVALTRASECAHVYYVER